MAPLHIQILVMVASLLIALICVLFSEHPSIFTTRGMLCLFAPMFLMKVVFRSPLEDGLKLAGIGIFGTLMVGVGVWSLWRYGIRHDFFDEFRPRKD